MFRVAVVLCVVLAVVKGNTTPASRCSVNGGDLPLNMYIEGCTQTPCPLARGTDAIIHMVFRSPRTIRRMRTYATAHIIATIPYPLGDDSETCNFLTNTYCPVMENEIVHYTLSMTIEDVFPLITVTIEFRIEDDSGTSFICVRLPVRVMAAGTMINALNGTMIGDV